MTFDLDQCPLRQRIALLPGPHAFWALRMLKVYREIKAMARAKAIGMPRPLPGGASAHPPLQAVVLHRRHGSPARRRTGQAIGCAAPAERRPWLLSLAEKPLEAPEQAR